MLGFRKKKTKITSKTKKKTTHPASVKTSTRKPSAKKSNQAEAQAILAKMKAKEESGDCAFC